jgi:hypothetical protein
VHLFIALQIVADATPFGPWHLRRATPNCAVLQQKVFEPWKTAVNGSFISRLIAQSHEGPREDQRDRASEFIEAKKSS